jgi:hypothetical protein
MSRKHFSLDRSKKISVSRSSPLTVSAPRLRSRGCLSDPLDILRFADSFAPGDHMECGRGVDQFPNCRRVLSVKQRNTKPYRLSHRSRSKSRYSSKFVTSTLALPLSRYRLKQFVGRPGGSRNPIIIILAPFSRAFCLVRTTKAYSGRGADIVMESITLTIRAVFRHET